MTYYHVVAPLEGKFNSVGEAVEFFKSNPLTPRIPIHTADGEERETNRICIAPSVELCLTAIGVIGTFRRCCAINQDAFDYATEALEVYPILICEFDDPEVYKPTIEQVPDVGLTRERWLLQPAIPDRVCLKWLHSRSIRWSQKVLARHKWVCKNVDFVEPTPISKHPWLNGFGNVLDSSEEEPTWRTRDAESYRIVYVREGEVVLDGDVEYVDIDEAFDVLMNKRFMVPRRHLVPADLLYGLDLQVGVEGYTTPLAVMSLD